MKKILLVLFSLVLAACVTVPAVTPLEVDAEFAVAAGGGNVVLANNGEQPVYYVVLEKEFSARARWAPCVDASACARVDAGQQVRVPYAQITGYQAGAREALVYWYEMVSDGSGGQRPGEVHSRTVQL